MGSLREWFKDEATVFAVLERIFQPNTLVGILVGGSTLGVWGYYPEKFSVIAGGLIGLYSVYQIIYNKRKAIRKEAENL